MILNLLPINLYNRQNIFCSGTYTLPDTVLLLFVDLYWCGDNTDHMVNEFFSFIVKYSYAIYYKCTTCYTSFMFWER